MQRCRCRCRSGAALCLLASYLLTHTRTTHAQSVSNLVNCSYVYSNGDVTATFDVSPLTNDYGAYAITDRYGGDDADYSYFFNICEQVSSDSIPNGDACAVNSAGGFQLAVPPDDPVLCKSTGQVSAGSFELISDFLGMEDVNPAMGLVLKYEGGDTCGPDAIPRSTHIVIECSNSENIPDDEVMDETQGVCAYVVRLPSKTGCPLECPVGGSDRQVCSGRGVCGYDKPGKKVRSCVYVADALQIQGLRVSCCGSFGGRLGFVLLLFARRARTALHTMFSLAFLIDNLLSLGLIAAVCAIHAMRAACAGAVSVL